MGLLEARTPGRRALSVGSGMARRALRSATPRRRREGGGGAHGCECRTMERGIAGQNATRPLVTVSCVLALKLPCIARALSKDAPQEDRVEARGRGGTRAEATCSRGRPRRWRSGEPSSLRAEIQRWASASVGDDCRRRPVSSARRAERAVRSYKYCGEPVVDAERRPLAAADVRHQRQVATPVRAVVDRIAPGIPPGSGSSSALDAAQVEQGDAGPAVARVGVVDHHRFMLLPSHDAGFHPLVTMYPAMA